MYIYIYIYTYMYIYIYIHIVPKLSLANFRRNASSSISYIVVVCVH